MSLNLTLPVCQHLITGGKCLPGKEANVKCHILTVTRTKRRREIMKIGRSSAQECFKGKVFPIQGKLAGNKEKIMNVTDKSKPRKLKLHVMTILFMGW